MPDTPKKFLQTNVEKPEVFYFSKSNKHKTFCECSFFHRNLNFYSIIMLYQLYFYLYKKFIATTVRFLDSTRSLLLIFNIFNFINFKNLWKQSQCNKICFFVQTEAIPQFLNFSNQTSNLSVSWNTLNDKSHGISNKEDNVTYLNSRIRYNFFIFE